MKKSLLISLLLSTTIAHPFACRRHGIKRPAEIKKLHNDYMDAKWRYQRSVAQQEKKIAEEETSAGWEKTKEDLKQTLHSAKEAAGHSIDKVKADAAYAWEKTKSAVSKE